MSRPFRHTDPGTDEPTWLLDDRWDAVPAREARELVTAYDLIVLLAPHPDDECLGAGGLLATALAERVKTTVVLASDGEGSHPHSQVSPAELARRRSAEASRAAAALGGPRSVSLSLPDGGLDGHVEAMAQAVAEALGEGRCRVLTTWSADGHPDHEAAARAVTRAVAGRAIADVAFVPVWLWQWGCPDHLPWDHLILVDLEPNALSAKENAIACHRTQVEPLGQGAGEETLLAEHIVARFSRVVETLIVPGEPAVGRSGQRRDRARTFDAMYDDGSDPWDFGRWYERRKRALTMAVPAHERYARVLDIGCATGELTELLAQRADSVVAVDVSERAIAIARARLGDPGDSIDFRVGECPVVIRELRSQGRKFDLIALSEVGYFLTGSELLASLRAIRGLLPDGGEVVSVHWRHPTDGIPLDGPRVDAQMRAVFGAPRVDYRDDDLLLTVHGGQVR